MNYIDSIAHVVGSDKRDSWMILSPTVYYRDGMPYGLIATLVKSDGVKYVASTVSNKELPFTIGMLRDIILMYKECRICLLTDVVEKQDMIRRCLDKYKFEYKYIDEVMYSYGGI